MSGRVRRNRLSVAFALCALGFAACNTYDPSLISTLNANQPAGSAGTSGSASAGGGGGNGGAAVAAGAGAVADNGGYDDAGAGGTVEGGDAGDSAGGTAGGLVGGASGGAGTGGTIVTAGAGGSVAGAPSGSFELIDDFEDGDGVVIPVHGRNGPWYTFSDATVGGKLSPSPFAVSALTGSNLHDSSTVAVHLTATGFTDWGAGVGADLVNVAAKKVAYDVSAYKGVHFYAKIGTGASAGLKMLVTTTYSDPGGGICSDAMPYTVPSKRCSDHLYFPKTIKTSWATYDVLFADLIQQGFGLPQASLDPKSVYSIQFTVPAKLAAVDLWLDDVSFIVK